MAHLASSCKWVSLSFILSLLNTSNSSVLYMAAVYSDAERGSTPFLENLMHNFQPFTVSETRF